MTQKYEQWVAKGWAKPITAFDKIAKAFAQRLLEDVRKYGFIDEAGYMYLDDGIIKERLGRVVFK